MTTPAGWYTDPERVGQQRYWDGQQWTEHRAPTPPPPPAVGYQPTDPPPPANPAPGPAHATADQARKLGGHDVKTWVIVGVVLASILVASGLVSLFGEDGETSSDVPVAGTPPSNDDDNASPSPTPAETTEKPEPAAKPITYNGSGDKILPIKKPGGDAKSAAIMTINNRGSSNFVVYTLNKNLRTEDLLVNTIGVYRGTVPLDFASGSATERLQIESSGSWTVTIKPLTAARTFTKSISGRGDDVVVYDSDEAGVANIAHSGGSNFVVLYYGDGDLLVNEIGRYKGQVPFTPGPAVVEITASGPWSISVR